MEEVEELSGQRRELMKKSKSAIKPHVTSESVY